MPFSSVGGAGSVGPAGPAGPPGPPGGASHVHTQTTPAATWEIIHPLGRIVDPILFDSASPTQRVYTDVTYDGVTRIIVEWPEPTTGSAYL